MDEVRVSQRLTCTTETYSAVYLCRSVNAVLAVCELQLAHTIIAFKFMHLSSRCRGCSIQRICHSLAKTPSDQYLCTYAHAALHHHIPIIL